VVIKLVHNFFVNVREELSTSIKTSKVHTVLISVDFVEIDGEFGLLVSYLVGDFALPLITGNLVIVDILLTLKSRDESHENIIGSTGGEELSVLAHIILEFGHLTRLLLINVRFSNVKVAKKRFEFSVVIITTSNSTAIFLSATSLTAFVLFGFNCSIDISLSYFEFLCDLLLS